MILDAFPRPRRVLRHVAGAALALLAGGALLAPSALVASGEPDATFVSITPCRLFDTRPGDEQVGPRSTPIGPGERFDVQVTGDNGQCSIPAHAVAVAINATAVRATAWSYATFFPADAPVPLSSSLNYAPGTAPTPNSIDVRLSDDGRLSVVNAFGTVDLVGDVTGYYTADTLDGLATAMAAKADSDDVYTKAEVDALLAGLGPSGYTDDEIDAMLDVKANRNVVYAQHEVDAAIAAAVAGKADAADVYTAAEIDALHQLLSTKDEVDEMLVDERIWAADVDDNGDKLADGPYTATRMAQGWYRVTFQLGPYQLPPTVEPVVTVGARCGGHAIVAGKTPFVVGGVVHQMIIDVLTYNFAAAQMDCPIDVMLRLVD